MNKSQGNNWWKKYRKEGIAGFLRLNYKGRPSPLQEKEELEKRLNEEGFRTINEARLWILETYGIEYTEKWIRQLF